MILYVDSTVVVRLLFEEPDPYDDWNWKRWESAYSSELLVIEARRAVDRRRLDGRLAVESSGEVQKALRELEGRIGIIELTRAVLDRASLPMATSVKTLGAIHLASAMMLRESRGPVVFATHDRQLATGAEGLGFDVVGV